MTKININGEPFVFEEENLSYASTKPMTHEEGKAILFKAKELFDSVGLHFYLGYGTLLGAIREHDFIKGDEDVDVFTNDEKKLRENLPYFHNNGLRVIRAVAGNTYSFKYGEGGYIDVYILRRISWYSPWSYYCYSISNHEYVPKKLFREFENIEFLGATFECPKNPEKVLEFLYGKDWHTPVSGHKFYYEVKTAYYYHKVVIPFIKKILLYDKWYTYIKK